MTRTRLTTAVACAVTLLAADTQASRAAQTVEGCQYLGAGSYACPFGPGTIECTLADMTEFCQAYASEYNLTFEGAMCLQGGAGGSGCIYGIN